MNSHAPAARNATIASRAVGHAAAQVGGPLLGTGTGQRQRVGLDQVSAVDDHERADDHEERRSG
jgi:hypothetical protein